MKIKKSVLQKIIKEEISRGVLLNKIRLETQILAEAGLSRVIGKYFDIGFIIISADRTCKAVKGTDCSEEEEKKQTIINRKNEEEIKKDISAAGFGYLPVYGGYKEEFVDPKTGKGGKVDSPHSERSFLIPLQRIASSKEVPEKLEDLKKLGMDLSAKYNQDTFLLKPPRSESDNQAYYLTKDGQVDRKFESFSVNDLLEDYFTQLRKNPGRFTLKEEKKEFVLFVPKPPSGLSEARNRYGEIFIRIGETK